MKLKTTAIAAIAISVIIGCTESKNRPAVSTPNNAICLDYSQESPSQLPVSLVHDMVTNYRIRNKVEGKYTKVRDAETIWFDLETLKKFLYHIELAAKNAETPILSKDLGVRIYYSRYPDKSKWDDYKYKNAFNDFKNDPDANKYGGKHTLIMIPTMMQDKDEGPLNIDFNPLDFDTYEDGLKNLNRYNDTSEAPMLLLDFIPKERLSIDVRTTSAQNHGSLIPPRKPGTNELAF